MKIAILGATGLLGTSLCKHFSHWEILSPSRSELDLTDQKQTKEFADKHKPEYVVVAAGLVGGINANSLYPADFGYVNGMIALNCMNSFRGSKLLYLGSGCMYPKECPQPMKPEYLMTGKLEPTSETYATAKLFGCRLASAYRKQYNEDYIVAIPCGLVGEHEKVQFSHVIPDLIRKFKTQNKIICFGTGSPVREFMHVDDLSEAIEILLLNYSSDEWVNVGSGEYVSIKELVNLIVDVTGFTGEIEWDVSKPDGQPVKTFDSSVMNSLGWKSKINLIKMIENLTHKFTYESKVIS